MYSINYQKRKNTELFKTLEDPKSLFLSNAQNFIPIYLTFFSLNDTNFNSINLNNKWFLTNVLKPDEQNLNLFNCKINNINNKKTKNTNVFFKLAPLLDPYKYLIGKYNVDDEKLFTLPKLNSTNLECNPKLLDPNNSAFVDGLFVYLTSNLMNSYTFTHGVEYYGSFLGIKNDFVINVFDDLDYLSNSDFFNKNKNVLFKIDDFDHLFQNENTKLKPIIIQHGVSLNSQLSFKSLNIVEETFECVDQNAENINCVELTDLPECSLNLSDFTPNLISPQNSSSISQNVSLKSNSTCSSRSSHTCESEITDCTNCGNNDNTDSQSEDNDLQSGDDDSQSGDDSQSEDESNFEEETINAIIPKFPVQVICMEYCKNTFDNLILTSDLTSDEWFSAFMQIIMILITYQKAFNFTHNDLHTNNIMYNQTDKKFINYFYKNKYYKVPTFGRIFKIIDFGRSIYKFDGHIFCSDSFQPGGDAAGQYNTEPYLNDKKPRLEPNYSFDLCRLACSIFDYVVEDLEEIKDLRKCVDPVQRLIVEWCLDDNGVNMLYKNNGTDRYPDFKLYKMIARGVHNHTPQLQLERPEFKKFLFKSSSFKGEMIEDLINIDKIPSFVSTTPKFERTF
jgi:hypothetical protein